MEMVLVPGKHETSELFAAFSFISVRGMTELLTSTIYARVGETHLTTQQT